MDWLTDNKIPVGKWAAKTAFDWLQDNGAWFFDGLADGMEVLIDLLLWVLQTPTPLIVIALFTALAWFLQRSWKTLQHLWRRGFLFILNQGYWEETTESLTLVMSACVVCMGVGVPIGIAACPPPRALPRRAAGAGPDADAADLCLSYSRHCLFRHRHGARA